HYRSPLDFDEEKLLTAGRGLERIKTSIRLLTEALARPVDPGLAAVAGGLAGALASLRRSFETAMDDDLNSALAIGVLFELARETNTAVGSLGPAAAPADRRALEEALALFKAFNGVLGIFKEDGRTGDLLLDGADGDHSGLVEGLINLLIEVRQEARKKKDWASADRIRDGLKGLNIILEDTPRGVRWKKQG
ncbi:MAG: cysteine--tRNA ligase, partial [Firmicutes bacterium]|nr:cysteine--tRNA ligase [Bacillota bacterium]